MTLHLGTVSSSQFRGTTRSGLDGYDPICRARGGGCDSSEGAAAHHLQLPATRELQGSVKTLGTTGPRLAARACDASDAILLPVGPVVGKGPLPLKGVGLADQDGKGSSALRGDHQTRRSRQPPGPRDVTVYPEAAASPGAACRNSAWAASHWHHQEKPLDGSDGGRARGVRASCVSRSR